MAVSNVVYVLAKRALVNGDDCAITIHGYTNDDVFVTSWENAAEHNVSYTVDLEIPASYEPLQANSQE